MRRRRARGAAAHASVARRGGVHSEQPRRVLQRRHAAQSVPMQVNPSHCSGVQYIFQLAAVYGEAQTCKECSHRFLRPHEALC